MDIDERLESLTTNMELLQGMMRDLVTKVDALVDTAAKHENEIRAMRGICCARLRGLIGNE